MAYIGNDLEVAFQSYLIIDDISSGFDGTETSFTLNVNGAVPVPFPINPQQCLISVAGVIQEPDPTGSSGFNLSGNNIVFSSPPAGSASFFGVVLAGADYVNVGVDFPAGSVAAPSITFVTDKDTGFFSKAANEIGIACAGTEVGVFSSTGLSSGFADGSAASPSIFFTSDTNTGIARAAADELIITTGGVERASFGSSEVVFNDPSNDVDFRVESNGQTHMLYVDAGNDRVGIGTSSPSQTLHVSAATGTRIQVSHTGGSVDALLGTDSGNAFIGTSTNHDFRFLTNNGERMRVDTSGRLLVGTTSARGVGHGTAGAFEIEGTSATVFASVVKNSADAYGGSIALGKSRGTSVGANTAVQSGDELGSIRFAGADGTDVQTRAAQITAAVDGTPGSNDMPGRLTFSTTADGASSPTERMRIDSSGRVAIGHQSASDPLHVKGASGIQFSIDTPSGGQYTQMSFRNDGTQKAALWWNNSSTSLESYVASGLFKWNIGSEKMRLDSAGRLMIGTTTTGNSAADDLTIENSGFAGMTIRSSSSTAGTIYFADGTSGTENYQGIIQYVHSADELQFYTNYAGNSNPRMRINYQGNVGIDFAPKVMHANVTSSLNVGSSSLFQRTNNSFITSNFYYNSSDVGKSIASGYGIMYSQNTADGRHNFNVSAASAGSADATHSIQTKVIIDNDGLKFNGDTAAVNALDDYEEGTWTPTLSGSSGFPAHSTQSGHYTKIGRLVHCRFHLTISSRNTLSGNLNLAGLPFTVSNVDGATSLDFGGFMNYFANTSSTAYFISVSPEGGQTSGQIYFRSTNNEMDPLSTGNIDNDFTCRGTLSYYA